VLGFEVAGTVDAVGSAVQGVTVGDDVAALLPRLGGYAEFALASSWTRKPPEVAWSDAAALPASAEAAVGVLAQLGVERGETLLILGAGGSVGVIGTQLARSGGLTVIGAAGAADQDLVRELGAVPVLYGPGLAARVREHVPAIDAVFDAAGAGGLDEAIELAGGPSRVITLADERAAELGVALSAPTPDRAPRAVDETMALLGSGALRLRAQTLIPMQRAAEAHALLDTGRARRKMVLVAPTPG
jgi:NADPH:quinone reductase-like Zn-dependent oxidoreductase